ncbi:hypothetical protein N9D43_01050 [Luminiphilus sp.]|nr:hypothetical protein [Luminiphilus sp.]
MQVFLSGVKQDYGAGELHFTDIYSGRGAWKGVPVSERVQVFDLMSMLMTKFNLPVFYQTSSAHFEASLIGRLDTKSSVWWDLKNTSHQALFLLLYVVFREIQKYNQEADSDVDFTYPFAAHVDEGLMKAGSEIAIPAWSEVYLDSKLEVAASNNCVGLQLADFAAFCISRVQWISAKQDPGKTLKEADRHILQTSGKLNCWNIDMLKIDPQNYSRDTYEWLLMKDRKAKVLNVKLKKPKLPKKNGA